MEQLMKNYLEYRKISGLSPATLKGEGVRLRKFKKFLEIQNLTVARVTAAEIKTYWESLSALKLTSVYAFLMTLRRFYHYCYTQNHVLLNPFRNLKVPRPRPELPRAIPTLEQLKRIFAGIDLTTQIGRRDRAVLELVYSAGLRLNEAIGLNLDDVDFANRLVKVRGKGNKERVVPFGKTTAYYLKLYLKDRFNPRSLVLFQTSAGNRMDRSAPERIFDRYAKRIGLKFKFHSLRHACALHLLHNKAGIRHIQELLGHSCPRTTQIYTQLMPLDLKKAHARYHPREKEARHG